MRSRVFNEFLDVSSDYFLAFDAQGSAIDLNRSLRDCLGYASDDLFGKKLEDLFHIDDQEALRKILHDSKSSEKPVYSAQEVRLISAKAELVLCCFCGALVTKDGFLVLSLKNSEGLSHGETATEKKLKDSVRKQEVLTQRLELAMRAGRFAVWDFHVKNNSMAWDRFMYELFEVPERQWITDFEAFEKFLLPEDAEKIKRDLASTFEKRGSDFQVEFRIKTTNADIKYLTSVATVIYDNDGRPERAVGMVSDVSDKKITEKNLNQAWAEVDQLFQLSADPMCIAGLDGKFRRVNPALVDILGYSEQELLSTPLIDFIHPDDRSESANALNNLLQGKKVLNFESRTVAKDGSIRILSWSSTPFLEGGYIYCAARDLTEIRGQEVKLLEATKLATLGEMAGGVAHEINNPLAIIKAKSDQLTMAAMRGNLTPEKTKEGLAKISETVERIAKIVRGLKSFSRNTYQEPMVNMEVSKSIEDALDLCSEKFRNHGILLDVKIDPSLVVNCRPVQISQILLNLLNNAFDAIQTQEQKWIRIESLSFGDRVQIAVVDSGLGISAELSGKIMLPFFTTKQVGKGTGLGLSISRGLAQDHGGDLYYDTKSKNTRFVLDLPMAEKASLFKAA